MCGKGSEWRLRGIREREQRRKVRGRERGCRRNKGDKRDKRNCGVNMNAREGRDGKSEGNRKR